MDKIQSDSVFVIALVSLALIPIAIYIYGVTLDLRRGKTGSAMIALGIAILVGLAVYPEFAIVCSILFVGAWLAPKLTASTPVAEALAEESHV